MFDIMQFDNKVLRRKDLVGVVYQSGTASPRLVRKPVYSKLVVIDPKVTAAI